MIQYLFTFLLFLFGTHCFAQDNDDGFAVLFDQAKQLSESGQKDSAISIQHLAIERLIAQTDSTTVADILIDEGKKCEQKGYYSLALIYYLKTISFAKLTGQKSVEGLAYLGLSNVDFRMANNNKALANSIEAVTVFGELGDTTHYITATMLMAQMYISLAKYNDALDLYLKMMMLAENAHDSVQYADNLDHIGVIYSFKGEYDEALSFHQKALKINNKISNQINRSINYANIGEIYLRKKQFDKALIFLKTALKIAEENDFRSLQIFVYYTLGETYSILKQKERAIASFNKSLTLIDELGEYREKPIVYGLLSQHYERQGNDHLALFFYKKNDELNDSLSMLDLAYKTEELKIVYEMDKREQELNSMMLQKQLQQNELKISKDTIRLQFIIIALVAIGLICTTIFGVYFYRNQRKLRLANNTKTILFSIIGHDLRGPVGNINKLIELLKDANAKDRTLMLGMLEKSSASVYELLTELLEWSKSISGKTDCHPQNFNLSTEARKAIAVVDIQAKEKMIDLQLTIPENTIVYADVNQIYTVLRNLVSNAIKFTPMGGAVSLEVEEDQNMVKIQVRDTGVGIEVQTLKKILDKDFVVSTYGTKNEKGSGLGLLLCQEFLKANGSMLHAESKLGVGSIFSFTLPKEKMQVQ